MYEDALFADQAYHYTTAMQSSDYILDNDLSNDDMSVYFNPTSKKAVVAYRGTRPSNISDLSADAAITTNMHSIHPRFKKAAVLAKKASSKYGKENTRLTGHSLGGSLALYANQQLGEDALETTVFNPGHSLDYKQIVSSSMYANTRKGQILKSKTHIYTHGKDQVSKGFQHGKGSHQVYVAKDKSGDLLKSHSLKVFLKKTANDFDKLS